MCRPEFVRGALADLRRQATARTLEGSSKGRPRVRGRRAWKAERAPPQQEGSNCTTHSLRGRRRGVGEPPLFVAKRNGHDAYVTLLDPGACPPAVHHACVIICWTNWIACSGGTQ